MIRRLVALSVFLGVLGSTPAQSDRITIAPDSALGQKAISIARSELEQHGVDTKTYWGAIVSRDDHTIHVVYCPWNPVVDPATPPSNDRFFHVELDETASHIVKTWFSP